MGWERKGGEYTNLCEIRIRLTYLFFVSVRARTIDPAPLPPSTSMCRYALATTPPHSAPRHLGTTNTYTHRPSLQRPMPVLDAQATSSNLELTSLDTRTPPSLPSRLPPPHKRAHPSDRA